MTTSWTFSLTVPFPQLTDWLQHTPKEVLAKNFKTDISAFDHIPAKELYMFPAGLFYFSPAFYSRLSYF